MLDGLVLVLALILNPVAKRRRTKDTASVDAEAVSASGAASISTGPAAVSEPSVFVDITEKAYIQTMLEVHRVQSHSVGEFA